MTKQIAEPGCPLQTSVPHTQRSRQGRIKSAVAWAHKAANNTGRTWRFWRHRDGNIAIEFAFIAPFLVLLLYGSFEVGRLVLAQIKNTRVAATVADLVTRTNGVTEADLDDIFTSGRSVGSPFDYTQNGRIIISSIIAQPGDGPRVVWQRAFPAGAAGESRVGAVGTIANLSNGFVMNDFENVIVAEAVFDYLPFSGDFILEEQEMYAQATNRPRGATLDQVLP